MMQRSLTRTVQNLLLLVIACTPLFALREFLKDSGIGLPHYALYFSFIKDFVLAVVLCLCVVHLFVSKNYPRSVLPLLLFFSAYTVLVAALSSYDLLMVLGGFRWSLPLLLLLLLCGHIDRVFMRRLVPVAVFLLLLNTSVQMYQLIHHQFRWGTTMYSTIFGRVSGFYELPSAAGFITCLFFFIIRYFFTGPRWAKNGLLCIAIFSTFFLSVSTTGYVLMLLMLVFPFVYRPHKYRPVYIACAILFGIVVYKWLDTLNGRYPGDSSISWNIRVGLLKDEWKYGQLISSDFGLASNSLTMIKSFFGKPLPDDLAGGGESFYPALLGNYGMLFFCNFILLLLSTFIHIFKKDNEAMMLFFFVAILGAATVRITETFPLGILIAVFSAYFIAGKRAASTKTHLKQAEIADAIPLNQ